jgi:hypothetical protein
MIKLLIGGVLLAHGIGHILGPLQVSRVATVNPQWHGDSWLLTGPLGTSLAQGIGVVLWVLSIAGFAAVAGVVVGWLPASWWQPLAIGSAAVSLTSIALFPMAFPTFSTLGAVAVDVALLVAVLVYQWTPSDVPA